MRFGEHEQQERDQQCWRSARSHAVPLAEKIDAHAVAAFLAVQGSLALHCRLLAKLASRREYVKMAPAIHQPPDHFFLHDNSAGSWLTQVEVPHGGLRHIAALSLPGWLFLNAGDFVAAYTKAILNRVFFLTRRSGAEHIWVEPLVNHIVLSPLFIWRLLGINLGRFLWYAMMSILNKPRFFRHEPTPHRLVDTLF